MVGALGFEPRSAGVSHFSVHPASARSRVATGRCSSWSSDPSDTHSSSFPCNWSPRYYQVILYPQGWLRERFPAYDALGRGFCQNEDASGPIEMLISVHRPMIAIETPHALGRTPTLSKPIIAAYFPSKRGIERNIATTNPADTPNPISINGERDRPRSPDLAIDPTPCAIIEGSMSHESHASQSPRYTSSENLLLSLHSLYL